MAKLSEPVVTHTFGGIVWNTLPIPSSPWLMIEVRDELRQEVSFSLLDAVTGIFLWDKVMLAERWWASLLAATSETALLTIYDSTRNPDAKSLLAIDVQQHKTIWSRKDFHVATIGKNILTGYDRGSEALKGVDLNTGLETPLEHFVPADENITLKKPFQYLEGHPYFDTVKAFLGQRLNESPVLGVEYLEGNGLVYLSYYTRNETLANFLVVLDTDGEIVLKEKLGDDLKGLGLETFFILHGSLIFVRNRGELISYRTV